MEFTPQFLQFLQGVLSQGPNAVIAVGLAAILWAGYKRIWIWGRDYTAMVAERDFWREKALELLGVAGAAAAEAENSANVAQQALHAPPPKQVSKP